MKSIDKSITEGFQGISFGIMNGLITTVGVLIGLGIITDQPITVLGIVLTGLPNSFANAAGIHVLQETDIHHLNHQSLSCMIYKAMILI